MRIRLLLWCLALLAGMVLGVSRLAPPAAAVPDDGPPAGAAVAGAAPPGATAAEAIGPAGDGRTDDTAAVQRLLDRGGAIRLPAGSYRLSAPLRIDLPRSGFTSLSGEGPVRLVMAGPGPAVRVTGTHAGTADPASVKPEVWARERAPLIDGLEIVGEHPLATGVEARGTMQLTLTRLVIRQTLHAIHLVERNRNLTLSDCHLYENRGAGVFYDAVNLHQSNISSCHISYNRAGGVVIRGGDVRNVQISGCDIEGNMDHAPDAAPTANVLLDSTGGSIGEVAITGCTIQHDHRAVGSANIRVLGQSTPQPFTPERRHGNIAISGNVLSDVAVNIDLQQTRGVSITGNAMWKGFEHDIRVVACASVVVSGNSLDRNPRYHYGDGDTARQGILLSDSSDCLLAANLLNGSGDLPAAIEVRGGRRVQVSGCLVQGARRGGIWVHDSPESRVLDCLVSPPREEDGFDVRVESTATPGR